MIIQRIRISHFQQLSPLSTKLEPSFLRPSLYYKNYNASPKCMISQRQAFTFHTTTTATTTKIITTSSSRSTFINNVKNIMTNINKPLARSVTTLSLSYQKRKGKKITMITAYDYPSAMHAQRAKMDIILVGDSVAMVELGYDTTQPMTLDQMLHHCQAVKRGVMTSIQTTDVTKTNDNDESSSTRGQKKKKPKKPLLVGDMPFGTYEYNDLDIALKNSYRMVKEGGMDAVKLEGGNEHRARTIKHIVDGGVAVMGHIGLTPQAISVIGGFRAQGRTASRARELVDEALRLQDAGAFALVLECVPSNVGEAITGTLEIPTIGIGAGNGTSGQVLVYHDMLGMLSHPHHEEFMPKFCKRYAQVGHAIIEGLDSYKRDVEEGTFPGEKYSPYVMDDEEKVIFQKLLEEDQAQRMMKLEDTAKKLKRADEYDQLSLYGNGEKH